jgi:nephrocystin-3
MNSPEPPTANRRIRVFVSSTFRDMMEERDELMTHARPELRRFCRERQVELVEVDHYQPSLPLDTSWV